MPTQFQIRRTASSAMQIGTHCVGTERQCPWQGNMVQGVACAHVYAWLHLIYMYPCAAHSLTADVQGSRTRTQRCRSGNSRALLRVYPCTRSPSTNRSHRIDMSMWCRLVLSECILHHIWVWRLDISGTLNSADGPTTKAFPVEDNADVRVTFTIF